MSDNLTGSVVSLVIWTHKTVLQCDLLGDTTFSIGLLRPYASARVLIKVKSTGTLVLDVLAVLTNVESVAIGFVRMRENSIFTRAIIVCTTCWLCEREKEARARGENV